MFCLIATINGYYYAIFDQRMFAGFITINNNTINKFYGVLEAKLKKQTLEKKYFFQFFDFFQHLPLFRQLT